MTARPFHTASPRWREVDAQLAAWIAARRTNTRLEKQALAIANELRAEFPEATCALNFQTPIQLLVATILSAQCTDVRVNQVTPALFRKYPTADAFARAPAGELEQDIHSTGFFNNKAKSIRTTCAQIEKDFAGNVPRDMESLLTLHGVARKTANVVRCNAFGLPGLTVDTHFGRLTRRLGLTKEDDPEKVEGDLAALLPVDEWTHFSHAIILHGRKTCIARKPKCETCRLADLCPSCGKVD